MVNNYYGDLAAAITEAILKYCRQKSYSQDLVHGILALRAIQRQDGSIDLPASDFQLPRPEVLRDQGSLQKAIDELKGRGFDVLYGNAIGFYDLYLRGLIEQDRLISGIQTLYNLAFCLSFRERVTDIYRTEIQPIVDKGPRLLH